MQEKIIIPDGLLDPRGRTLIWAENDPQFPPNDQSRGNGTLLYLGVPNVSTKIHANRRALSSFSSHAKSGGENA